jgi:hypothetical protein
MISIFHGGFPVSGCNSNPNSGCHAVETDEVAAVISALDRECLNSNLIPTVAEQQIANHIREHHDWYQQFDSNQPIYRLPMEAIEELRIRQISRRQVAFLDRSQVEAERSFTELCERHQILGILDNREIKYHNLTPPEGIKLEQFPNIPWLNEASLRVINSGLDRASATRERLLGLAGWLVTDSTFLEELGQLQTAWESLEDNQRPSFPLQRQPPPASTPQQESPVSAVLAAFREQLRLFCNRYGLMSLASWDLPDPQGPFFTDPLGPNSAARPQQGLYLFIPLGYPVQNNDDLLETIAFQQREIARLLGMNIRMAGFQSHVSFAKAFKIDLLEKAIRSRFRREPRGIVSAITAAAATVIGSDPTYVKELRKDVAARRRGDPTHARVLE